MMKRVRAIWTLLFVLFSCSTITTLDIDSSRRNQYEEYLRDNLKVEKLYLKLRETASGKALKVTPTLTELQSRVVPGFEAKAASDKTLFIVSLEMPDWSRFSIADFKFYWGDVASKSVKEIMDGQLLQTLYPFAVPHDRAFYVEFEGVASEVNTLKVQTSQGQFTFVFGEGN